MVDDGTSYLGCPPEAWPTCEHMHYLGHYVTNTLMDHRTAAGNMVTVPLRSRKREDRPNTFDRAKNPMVRSDKKLQRGF